MTRTSYQTLETLFNRLQTFEDDFLYFYSLDFYFPHYTRANELVQVELIYNTLDGQQNDLFSVDEATCIHVLDEFELLRGSLVVIKPPVLNNIYNSFYRIQTVNDLLKIL